MAGLVEIATSILLQAGRHVEVSAQNVANITTPGYKKHVVFKDLVGVPNAVSGGSSSSTFATDFSQGNTVNTGSPYDIAIEGAGFFVLKSENGVFYSRSGQFQRDSDGRLTLSGVPLQTADGGDLVLKGADVQITSDGAVLEGGQPVARLAIVDFDDRSVLRGAQGGMFTAVDERAADVEAPTLRQGALEASNVSTGDEMVAIMQALRRAESGQRLVGVYDDLMGRAITAFGQA